MTPSGAVDAAKPGEDSRASNETTTTVSTEPKGGSGLPLPDVSVWAKWVLGPVLLFAVPFYKRILGAEEVVEKRVEATAEWAEEVAEVVEKVAADVAKDLPAGGGLTKMAIEVEDVADMVIIYARKTESFIHKVDEIKDALEEVIEPAIKKVESIEEEGKQNVNSHGIRENLK